MQHAKFRPENFKGRDCFGDQGINEGLISKWILGKLDVNVETGLNWLRM
jgi:hypothetical protein